MQLPPPSFDAEPVKIIRRGPIVAAVAATAIALIVISQVFMGGPSSPGYDPAGYQGATAVTLAPGETVAAPAKFHATDWRFRAGFPSSPERSVDPIPFGPRSVQVVSYTAAGDGVEYVVGVIPISGLAGADYTDVLADGARNMGARLESSRTRTFHGYNAAEGVMRSDGEMIRAITFGTPDRVFMIMVGAEADPVSAYEQFRDSLEIL